MGNKKKNPLRDIMHSLQNSVLQKDDMSIMIGGNTNHTFNDNSGIGDDCPN